MKPTLIPYLKAVGFDVIWAKDANVNVRSDRALVAYARHYHRILLCHDKHVKPYEHKIQVCQEIYKKGGQVIQVAGNPSQEPLTSLGKILVHRKMWKEFFLEHDGIITVSDASHIKSIERKDLLHSVQGALVHSSIPVVAPKSLRKLKAVRKSKPQSVPIEQAGFNGLFTSPT